jgi:HD-GYP domain-containing protein (c-di-GMP phosphodiesterase class II)
MARLPLPVLESIEFYKRHDPYTYHHILLVFALSSHLARNLLDNFEEILQEAAAGSFHDFGKICVPLEILTKKTPLRKSERKALEHHTLAGFLLLSYYLKDPGILAAVVARDHHERLDGSGYPGGSPSPPVSWRSWRRATCTTPSSPPGRTGSPATTTGRLSRSLP